AGRRRPVDEQLVQGSVGGLAPAVGKDGAAVAEGEGAADLAEDVEVVPALAAGEDDVALGDLGGEVVGQPVRPGELLQAGGRGAHVRGGLVGEQAEAEDEADLSRMS